MFTGRTAFLPSRHGKGALLCGVEYQLESHRKRLPDGGWWHQNDGITVEGRSLLRLLVRGVNSAAAAGFPDIQNLLCLHACLLSTPPLMSGCGAVESNHVSLTYEASGLPVSLPAMIGITLNYLSYTAMFFEVLAHRVCSGRTSPARNFPLFFPLCKKSGKRS